MAQDGRHHTKCGLVGEGNEEDDAGTVGGNRRKGTVGGMRYRFRKNLLTISLKIE